MKLNYHDRLMLLQVLPDRGDFLTLKIVSQLRDQVAFTEEEFAESKMTRDGGVVKWNPEKEKEKEVEIGEVGLTIIREALRKLNESKDLTPAHMPIYEKFIESGTNGEKQAQ